MIMYQRIFLLLKWVTRLDQFDEEFTFNFFHRDFVFSQ